MPLSPVRVRAQMLYRMLTGHGHVFWPTGFPTSAVLSGPNAAVGSTSLLQVYIAWTSAWADNLRRAPERSHSIPLDCDVYDVPVG